MIKRELARGSQWNQWDLHVHTPASFHWQGKKFDIDPSSSSNRQLVDEMIDAMNKADPVVFAIMDYWTFEGWFALKNRLKEQGAPELKKMVFPGIELRLAAPMVGRLNAHVIFSDLTGDQVLRDFMSLLELEIVKRPLSKDALIELARRKVGEDKLKIHGFTKDQIEESEEMALLAGSVVAEINPDSYREAIARVPNGYAIGFMPFDTNDGLAEIKWQEHYAYAMNLFKSSPIFETRNIDLWGAFVGEKTQGNENFYDNFQAALENTPRLAVSGSDAHCFYGVSGSNDKRGYGDFPSGKKTWIKSDPTFRGLKQAILEPAKRSFIGDKPPKLKEVEANKTYYIESIEISKTGDKQDVGQWLDGCDIPLNHDLVAIIGNKGSGKSALADVIATLGNSKQSKHFSFLTDLLLLKIKQIDEHEKLKPEQVAQPSQSLNLDQQIASDKLAEANKNIELAKKRALEITAENTELAKLNKAIANVKERFRLLQRSFDQAILETSDDMSALGISWSDIAKLEIKGEVLDRKSAEISIKQTALRDEAEKNSRDLERLDASKVELTAKLDAPQQQFETYQRNLAEWERKLAELIGTPTEPETKSGIEARMAQISELPTQLSVLESKRLNLTGEIFEALDSQRKAREQLFDPIQELIKNNKLIREDYRLQFQASLSASSDAIADQLFGLIKQTWGEFRGQDEAQLTIRKLFDSNDLNSHDGALAFVTELHEKVSQSAVASGSQIGIFNLVKKGQSVTAVYDMIFGLNFLEPRYSLLFQDTKIEQLSPGQRGALLLIFYLLVDKGKTPIILDQPEENLDNETVYRLLVPVLAEGKKERQIIMVTHNPNLAVVCDAEQIIYSKFDRAENFTISYESGSIENSALNGIVVTVLEGTKPAFDNRSGKYH